MVSVVFAPLLTNVQAATLFYNNTYDNPTDVTITDGSCIVPNWVTSTVTVTDNVVLDRVDVNADIPRSALAPFGGRERDLIVTLTSPGGTSVTLWNRVGNLQDLAINQANVGFVGENAFGIWTLSACDAAANGRFNYINDFSLTIYWDFHLTIVKPVSGNPISSTAYLVQADSNGNAAQLWMDSSYVADMTYNGGSGYWEYTLDTTAYHEGMHNLVVKATNGMGDTLVAQMGVQVQNYAYIVTLAPADGSTLPSGVTWIGVSAASYTTKATLSVDGLVISTQNGNPPFNPWYIFNINTANFQDGQHLITGTAYDPDGNPTSATVTYYFSNYPISCTITAPPNPGFVITTISYTIKATVPATAVKGELYVDGVLTTVTTTIDINSQYDFPLTVQNYKSGSHVLEVIAYNQFGKTASDVMNVQFDDFSTFFVNIQSPTSGTGISGSSSNPYTVVANTNSYALKGDLYVDLVLVAEDNSLDLSNDFTFTFNPEDFKDGPHTLTVRAYDPNGDMVQSSVDVIFQDYTSLFAFIYTPLNAAVIGINQLTLNVNAWVDDSTTTYGDLYVDNQWVQRLYYTMNSGVWELDFSFNTTSYKEGSHTLRVVAYAPDGTTASSSVTVTFKRWTNTVAITSPASGTTLITSPTNIRVTSTLSLAAKCEIYVDGTLAASSTNIVGNTYNIPINNKAFNDGLHSISAKVYDPDGNFATVSISVTFDDYRATVTITSPANGATGLSGAALPVSATVVSTSTNGVSDTIKGECYIDNSLMSVVNAAPSGIPTRYSFTVDTTKFTDSTHVIKVIIYDTDGETSVASNVVTFHNFDITVTINSPATAGPFSNNLIITATTKSYATKGEFYVDNVYVGLSTILNGLNQYSYTLNTKNFADGTHTIKVQAYDPTGNSAIDTKVVTFQNYAMSISITKPVAQNICGQVSVVATVNSGQADSAKLYVDNTLVTTSVSSVGVGGTYTLSLDTTGFADGNHIITVVAAYSIGGVSATSTKAYKFDNTVPTVTGLTVIYLNGLTAVRASGDAVVITATVSDATSGIKTVTLDATNIGGASGLTMFDDGSHHDGNAGDGLYGSDPVNVTGKMGYMRVFVTATDNVGNTNSQSTSVAIDDHLPIITNTYVVYPGAQSAAKTSDDVRIMAKIIDTTVFVDVVLIIDNSSSMSPVWDTVKSDAKDFVDSLGVNDRAAIYAFQGPLTYPKQVIGFTQDKATVKNAIDTIHMDFPNGGIGTPLYSTIYNATAYAKLSNNMPMVVVLTDGVDCSGGCNPPQKTINDVKGASVPIFTIGLGNNIDTNALTTIATTSNGGAYYASPTVAQLKQIYQSIANKIKQFEVGGISSANVDLLNIGLGSSNPMYDDGAHGDGAAKDNVFGSTLLTIISVATDAFNYTVTGVDVGGNTVTLVGPIDIDNTPPVVTGVKPMFQGLNWWVADGDSVRFSANVSDPGRVGGIMNVKMDATSIGGGPSVVMRDDGTNGDVAAGDGVFTSDLVSVSTGLATGIKTVSIYATDIASNLGSGLGGIYVDNHRPMVIEIVSPGLGQYIEGKYTFQVRSNDVAGTSQVQIKIDRAWHTMAYNAQSSYYEYIMDTTTLSDNAYKISVQISDIAGKVQNGPMDQLFYIDNTPPTLVLNDPTDGDVVQGSIQIDTSGTTDKFLATIEWKADDLAWTNITIPWNTTSLTDGQHTLTVRAKDKIGHVTTRTITVIVDNGLPSAYFVTPAAGQVLSGKVTFQVKATDLVEVTGVALIDNITGIMEYNGGTGYYELQVDTTFKPDGTYTVGGLVTDLVGHILEMSPVTFYIDNNVPVIKIIKPAYNAVLVGNVSVQLNVTDGPFQPVSILWRVDEGSWKTVTAQTFFWNTTTYTDAKHTFYVQATDKSGHVVTASVPIIIDNKPPTIDLATPVNGQVIEGTYIFKMHAYSMVGIDKVVLQIFNVNNWTIINNEGTVYFEQSIDTTAMKDNSYFVQATAYDIAGHSTKSTKIKVNVNNVAPKLTVNSPSDNQYISGNNFTVSGSAQGAFLTSIEYNVDGQGSRPINQTLNTTLLADGVHTITVVAKDQAGHVTSYSARIYVDNQKPTVSPVSPQQLEPVSGKYTFRVRAEDVNGIGSVKLIFGNLTLAMFQNSVTGYYEATRDTTLDGDGQRSFIFSVVDRSGKEVNLTVPSRIDNSAPNVTLKSPGSGAQGVITYKVEVSDPSGIDTVLIRIGGGDWREMRLENGQYTFKWKSVYSDNGDQPFDIKATDKLGNSQIYSYNLSVNNPSSKQNYDWLWWILFIMLIVCILGVALTSRSGRSSSARDARSGPRGYDTRMAAEEEDDGVPRPLPGRMAGQGGPRPPAPTKELGTPAHRVAVKKLESEAVVVSRPQDDEVTFMSTEDDIAQAPMMAGAVMSTGPTGQDEVAFMDESAPTGDDEVAFEEDGQDEVSFSDDSQDEVAFMDDSAPAPSDEVAFSEDSGDEVSFSDDSAPVQSDEDVEFLDDEEPAAPAAPKPPERRVPVALTPRRVQATPVVTAKKPPPTVSKGAISGIDDLLGGRSGSPKVTATKAPPPKPAPSKGSSPLDDVIGGL